MHKAARRFLVGVGVSAFVVGTVAISDAAPPVMAPTPMSASKTLPPMTTGGAAKLSCLVGGSPEFAGIKITNIGTAAVKAPAHIRITGLSDGVKVFPLKSDLAVGANWSPPLQTSPNQHCKAYVMK